MANNSIPISLANLETFKADLDSVLEGKASLVSGKVPASQLPSYVDDTVEGWRKAADGKFYANRSGSEGSFVYTDEITGESSKIYIDLATNTTWRWSGSAYVQIKGDLAIGDITGTAFDGGRGKDLEDNLDSLSGDLSSLSSDLSDISDRVDALEDPTYATDAQIHALFNS